MHRTRGVSLHPLLTAAYRRRFVVILLLVAVMNFADRAVFSVLSPLIRQNCISPTHRSAVAGHFVRVALWCVGHTHWQAG